jgi:TPR repeat protein
MSANFITHEIGEINIGIIVGDPASIYSNYPDAQDFDILNVITGAKLGMSSEIYLLGQIYESGGTFAMSNSGNIISIPKEHKTSYLLYEYAHALGYHPATFQLGLLNLHGVFFDKDEGRALEYFTSLSEFKGEAAYYCGVLHTNSGRQDIGITHFHMAANLGHYNSIFNLITCYFHSESSTEDLEYAAYFCKKAIKINPEDVEAHSALEQINISLKKRGAEQH